MGKTLAVILNFNLPEITDNLYESLVDFQENIYDLVVMDNGSSKIGQSKYTTVFLPKNVFWGGGLNAAFQLVLDNVAYDSLLFFNNDLELNGYNFIKNLRIEMFSNDFAIVSPCMAGNKGVWRQMLNWGSPHTRQVMWIDNQAPLINRKVIEAIGQFDESLNYGWGQEVIMYRVCKKNNWGIGVCDHISVHHFGAKTLVKNKIISKLLKIKSKVFKSNNQISRQQFIVAARKGFKNYFTDKKEIDTIKDYGRNYTFDPFNE